MKKKSAFTLIELLVVVSIIAILMALLFPVLSGYMERARATGCLNNLKSLGQGITQYLSDSKGSFFRKDAAGDEIWPVALHSNYVKDWRSFRSPFDKFTALRPSADKDPAPDPVPISYGLNDNLMNTFDGKWTAPTSTLIMAAPAVDTTILSKLPTFKADANSKTIVTVKPVGNPNDYSKYGTHRLRTALNVLFADGHVSDMEWSKYVDNASAKGKRQWDPAYEDQ